MTGEDLLARGYWRALWYPGPGKWWVRPDESGVVEEEQALRELAGAARDDEEDRRE
jgi:hypothetical protein